MKTMYRIGMFSKMGKVTVKTLHHYDEVGLLTPAHVDQETGYRYYDTEQLFALNDILGLRQMGFSIQEITDIFAGRNVEMILAQRRAELISERERATDQLFRLEHYQNQRKDGMKMDYQVVVKEIPACIVFAKRQILPNYAALTQAVPAVGMKVAEANPTLQCVEPSYCFNVYLDGEYRQENIDVEICQAVTGYGKETDGIVFKEMPAVQVASLLHKGPYEALGSAYAYGLKWAQDNGYRVADHIRESYIDGIWNCDDVADWLTEVQIPITKQ